MRRAALVLAALLSTPVFGHPEDALKAPDGSLVGPEAVERASIEVVFCLDTTGSMSGIIDAAKRKIWAIANDLATARPSPRLRFGLVAYRDVGDEYVTKRFPLTDDIDAIHTALMGLSAEGGGDGPEHVNAAVHDAVEAMEWSSEARTVRMIFVVGDAPPHMDYGDGFDYRVSVMRAVERGIYVHAISCSNYNEEVWRDIARRGEGSFRLVEPDLAAAAASVPTPHDTAIAELRRELGETVAVAAGGRGGEVEAGSYGRAGPCAAPAPGDLGRDLVDAYAAGELDLDDVAEGEMPEDLRGLDRDALAAALGERAARRGALRAKLAELEEARAEFVEAKRKDADRSDTLSEGSAAFDRAVADEIRRTAEKEGVDLRTDE
ncbi:MAG: VWA domain-containing protein [Planctomycetes bacterium]|nr:VWA domain-containing protein [Planctomycetota bacterium]